jgi:hypothetical protein
MISVPRVHFLCSGKETSKIRLDDDDDHIITSPFETCENNNTLLCLSFSLFLSTLSPFFVANLPLLLPLVLHFLASRAIKPPKSSPGEISKGPSLPI